MSRTHAAYPAVAHRMGRAAWLVLALGLGACGLPATPTAPVAPATPAASTPASFQDIALVSSSPAAGSTLVTGGDPNGLPPGYLPRGTLSLTFAVQSSITIDAAQLEIDLVDGNGQRCGYLYTKQHTLPGGTPVTISTLPTDIFAWNCALPVTTTSVTATLLTLTGPGPQLTRTTYVARAFTLTYSYQAFPPAPGGAPSLPSIATLGWHDYTSSPCAGYCHSPGDTIIVYCGASEADGASLTTTLTLTWDDGTQQTKSVAFPAGASSLPSHLIPTPSDAVYAIGATVALYPTVRAGVNGAPPHATAVCSAVNVRGETATRTINFPQ